MLRIIGSLLGLTLLAVHPAGATVAADQDSVTTSPPRPAPHAPT